MARSRRGSENPVSFFSFQDVMMCTIGVTIVITMMLVLQLGAAAAKVEVATTTVDPAARVALDAEARALRTRLESAAAKGPVEPGAAKADLRQRMLDENARAERLARRSRELAQRVRVEAARTAADPASMEAADLLQRRDELEEKLRAEALRRRVTYLVAEEDRLPVIVEVSGDRIVAGTTLEQDAPRSIPLSDVDAAASMLAEWMRGLPQPDRRSVLFVVKPSGVAAWRAVAEAFAAQPGMQGVPAGLDLITEDAFTSDRFRPAEARP